jgi:ribose transport system permease protein
MLRTLFSLMLRDYGMIVILALLICYFAIRTRKEQFPSGAEAGRQAAQIAVDAADGKINVIIVCRDTVEDREFSAGAQTILAAAGATVLSTVNGQPPDFGRAMAEQLAAGKTIDVVIANEAAASWPVFRRYDQFKDRPPVTPKSYIGSDFLKLSNLIGVANQTAIYAIIAVGMTMVIVTAGIDLSVGGLVALAAVSAALLIRESGGGDAPLWLVILGISGGILLSALAGAFSGLMITRFELPPFIVTLAMMMAASGLAFRITQGQSIPELPESFMVLGSGRLLGLPNPIWIMLFLYGVGYFVMSKTILGRYIYAIGGNEEAARLSGVPVKPTLMVVYTVSGALAGLGGVLLASQLAAGNPKLGTEYELRVIAAVVVGGTSLMGGKGQMLGTLIGAFIITVIKNGMNLLTVDSFNQKIVLGGVLLLAVLIDKLKQEPHRIPGWVLFRRLTKFPQTSLPNGDASKEL